MNIAILNRDANKIDEVVVNIETCIREDIFKKAYEAESSLFYQEKGADQMAGKRYAINLSKRRKRFRTTYGSGGSRTPKKVMSARGRQFRYVGAFAPNTVGGRRAHPPKSQKNIFKTMNYKEWKKALLIGVSSSYNKEIVSKNGQKVPQNYPFVLDSSIEDIGKTKEFKAVLEKLGFAAELERTSIRKVRAGRGTMRNRTYKKKRGPLIVIEKENSSLAKAARNFQGFDVTHPDMLLASDFGMSEKPGRIVLFTRGAIEQFKEEFL